MPFDPCGRDLEEDRREQDAGDDDEERKEKEPQRGRLARLLVLFGCVEGARSGGRARFVGHRTGRYLLAWVIGLGTKIASFSQTVSHSRQDTQGPASTSAILWNVSWSGSSIR